MAADFESLSDAELARQVQAGSMAAFEALVSRYEARLYSFVLHCCRNEADARELTQDAFVRAFQAIAQFDARHSFAAWLFTIARRKCIDRRRASRPVVSEALLPELADDDDPSELLARQEAQQDLWRVAREVLPDAQFQALWLRYAEDMNVAAIAQVLSKTVTHVKVLLFRARETLARKLKSARESGVPGRQGAARGTVVFPPPVAHCAAASVRKGLL